MFLKPRAVQVFAPHPIVPTMKGDAMVIYHSCGVNCPLEMPIALVTVQLELESLHANMIAYRMQSEGMKQITVRCSDQEYEQLVKYCQKAERSLNDVLRELIRKLNGA
jgi:hypothetical protein